MYEVGNVSFLCFHRDAKNMAKNVKDAVTDCIQYYLNTTGEFIGLAAFAF